MKHDFDDARTSGRSPWGIPPRRFTAAGACRVAADFLRLRLVTSRGPSGWLRLVRRGVPRTPPAPPGPSGSPAASVLHAASKLSQLRTLLKSLLAGAAETSGDRQESNYIVYAGDDAATRHNTDS
jgi:hypothetical protein